jgi:hypothetical protein
VTKLASADLVASTHSEAIKMWGFIKSPTSAMAIAWAGFQIYLYFDLGIDSLVERAGHLGFAIALALNLMADHSKNKVSKISLRVIALTCIAPMIFIAVEIDRIRLRTPLLDDLLPVEIVLALFLLTTLLMVGYRVMGLGITLVASLLDLSRFSSASSSRLN